MIGADSEEKSATGKIVAAVAVLVVLVIAAATAYAFFVEPERIEVTRHTLSVGVNKPMKIAHITDLHMRAFGTRERLLVNLVTTEKPDLIVITGDTISEGSLELAAPLLRQLAAPLGIWAVRGDWEHLNHVNDEKAFYESVGAHFLDNQGLLVRDDLWLAGLDDPFSGHADMTKALAGAPAAAYKVVLFHAPDYFSEVAGLFDLGLAGHTHGGQVRLPAYGPLWLPEQGRRYVQGWFSENRSHLYVSRGIGTTNHAARFLCPPELAIIELRPN